jgi:CHAT domain
MRCYIFLKEWSYTKYELSRWLTMLRSTLDTQLRLIVWDDTDFGIAWELFWHRTDDGPAWLGTVVQMIRWTTVHDQDLHDQFSAEAGEYGGAGEILFYEDSELVKSQLHRICVEPLPCPGYRQAATMHALLDALADASQTYGAVYVRGHGKHNNEVEKAILAGVSLAKLAARELTALRKSRALVFLNACNSARAVIDPVFGDGANRNFAEAFLRQRARAVIATMAEVPIGQSAVLAQTLVRKARGESVRVPEYLRAQRDRHARVLPEPTDELPEIAYNRIRSFLYVSMIVYFGHPDAVFRLGRP